MQNFPKSPSLVVPVIGFHAGIGAILVLAAAFWVKLSLLQTLPILGLLAAVTVVVGHRALSGLAQERLNAEVAK